MSPYLGLNFADVVRFPPHQAAGIAVFRLPKTASIAVMEWFARHLLTILRTDDIVGRLWIVEAGRIRVHQRTGPDDPDDKSEA